MITKNKVLKPDEFVVLRLKRSKESKPFYLLAVNSYDAVTYSDFNKRSTPIISVEDLDDGNTMLITTKSGSMYVCKFRTYGESVRTDRIVEPLRVKSVKEHGNNSEEFMRVLSLESFLSLRL